MIQALRTLRPIFPHLAHERMNLFEGVLYARPTAQTISYILFRRANVRRIKQSLQTARQLDSFTNSSDSSPDEQTSPPRCSQAASEAQLQARRSLKVIPRRIPQRSHSEVYNRVILACWHSCCYAYSALHSYLPASLPELFYCFSAHLGALAVQRAVQVLSRPGMFPGILILLAVLQGSLLARILLFVCSRPFV